MRKYAAYLVAQGHNVCILENDFGAVNVDAMLAQDLLGDRCDLETISGGCDCDTHQRRMRTKLIAMAMRGFARVVVEPSGIFDVDEFFDVLRDDPLDRWYRIGNVIAIVAAMLPEALSPQAEYLLASETANAGRAGTAPDSHCPPGPRAGSLQVLPPLCPGRDPHQGLGRSHRRRPCTDRRLRHAAGQLRKAAL